MIAPSLAVRFCGATAPNPFLLSSSPVGNTYEMVARAFDTGWGGAVFKTIGLDYEVRITHPSPRLNALHLGAARVIGLQNVEQISDRPAADNFADLARLKRRYPDRLLVASVMGLTREEDWAELAKRAEDAGADVIECNFSCPQMTVAGTGHSVGQDSDAIRHLTELTKRACSIPVMAKLTPNVADMVPMALGAKAGGADAISAINTVKAITGVDIDEAVPLPNVGGRSSASGYSGAAVKPIALRFVADMARETRLGLPLSAIGGITTWIDAVEFLLLGATTLQVTTAILRHGYRIIEDLCEGLADYVADHGHQSVQDVVGKAVQRVVDPAELSHATRAVSLIDRGRCLGCGQCYLTCRDGGGQAIALDAERRPTVDEAACFGCLMCKHICPVWDCISYKVVPRT
ncbi:MAG: NAD-dependent dihydropyrimidine dehydrogenase subunit PreA [Pseudomonadota bacterium]